jgi:hypothetical protein
MLSGAADTTAPAAPGYLKPVSNFTLPGIRLEIQTQRKLNLSCISGRSNLSEDARRACGCWVTERYRIEKVEDIGAKLNPGAFRLQERKVLRSAHIGIE